MTMSGVVMMTALMTEHNPMEDMWNREQVTPECAEDATSDDDSAMKWTLVTVVSLERTR